MNILLNTIEVIPFIRQQPYVTTEYYNNNSNNNSNLVNAYLKEFFSSLMYFRIEIMIPKKFKSIIFD